ncbi:MAG TPA: beta-propeller fold lactonase family protein [Bacteroidales bacterium]|nr:beta-propeller fold lactonase family protein [Bacteroidales bacterium]
MKYILCITLLSLSLVTNSQNIKFTPSDGSQRPYQLSWDRIINPAGWHVIFGFENLENHSLDAALSPDGKWLAIEERTSIMILRTKTNEKVFTFTNNSYADLMGGMNTYSGIRWHEGNNGLEIFWSTTGKNSTSYVVCAQWNGAKAAVSKLYEYRTIPPAILALPNEFIFSREASGEYIYVVLNGCNRLIKQNIDTRDTSWIMTPGVAPYGITMASGKLYVTNWAGGTPDENDREVAGVPWGLAKVDNNKGGSTRESSVAVISPDDGKILKQIITGLHSNDIISDSKGRFVYVTNSNSDDVSVIDTRKDEVTETVSVRLEPEINPYFGDSPNGLCLSNNEKTLYVANGLDNAIAVISLGSKACSKSKLPSSRISGFIPTGAYPSSVTISTTGVLYVSNLEGAGVTSFVRDKNTGNKLYNSHRMSASISVIRAPSTGDLKSYTDTVVALNNLSRALSARLEPRKGIAPVPVPERIGEPSLFRHVLYIIKENRTYDQVLGDVKQGNGDSTICIFGRKITPNIHKIVNEFQLLDNLNVSGKCSAEGHQWTDASIVTDYIEKNMKAWFRSYAHVQTDALVYAPTGFLWDNALKHGKKVRIYGEASSPHFPNPTTWKEVYSSFISGQKVEFSNVTTIDPVRPILSPTYPSYGNHEFPDIMRADAFIKELKGFEKMDGDQLPDLMIMALPNDHTAGTRPGSPTPRAMVADNDLALGMIIQAISESRFWQNTVVFVIEDDSQNGWDHVSAFRTEGAVISPYSRLKKTIHTYYSQPSVVRTIEQILGLPPMNIQDAIAVTMKECFNNEPDLSAYRYVNNNIPLDEMNPGLTSLSGKALHYARASMRPEYDGTDTGDDDLLNRILWFSARGNTPYPSRFVTSTNADEDDE